MTAATASFGDIVLAPSGDKNGQIAFEVLMRIDGQPADTCTDPANLKNCIIARRQIRFSEHDELHMRVDLRSSCAGVFCDEDKTCAFGQCVSAVVSTDCHDGCDDSSLGATPPVTTPPPVDSGADSAPPVPVVPNNLTSLAVGSDHSCAIAADKTVRCWGGNSSGALGNNTTNQSSTPVTVMGLTDVVSVSGGLGFNCALTTANVVKCWGFNDAGQIGDGTTNNALLPLQVMGLTDVRSSNAGCKHACAVTNGGATMCWGDNGKGQVGISTGDTRIANVVQGLGAGSGALFVAGGFEFSCIATKTGAKCWGDDTYGQLGDGTTNSTNMPVAATMFGFGPTILTAGAQFALAYAPGNPPHLIPWGQSPGVAGLGSSSIDEAWAGDAYACARIGDGVKCWGSNDQGQLGDGTTTANANGVTPIGLGSGVVEMHAGYDHACARLTSGKVMCWGTNGSGQLGDGTTAQRLAPVQVQGL